MKRMMALVAVVVVVGVVAFFFLAPVVPEPWVDGNPKGPVIRFTAKASPSFYLLGYGMLYNYSVTTNGGRPYTIIGYGWESKCPGFPACR